MNQESVRQTSDVTEENLCHSLIGTIVVGTALLAIFQIESLIVAKTALTFPLTGPKLHAYSGVPDSFIVFLAPWIHFSSGHILNNLLFFLPVSGFFERWSELGDYFSFIILFGYLTNVIVPGIAIYLGLSTGTAFGVSGIILALAAHEVVVQGWYVLENHPRILPMDGIHLVVVTAVLGYGTYVTVVSSQPSMMSKTAHGTGIIVGAILGVNKLNYLDEWISEGLH